MEPPQLVYNFILCSTSAASILYGIGCVLGALSLIYLIRHSTRFRNISFTNEFQYLWDDQSFYKLTWAYRLILDFTLVFLFILLNIYGDFTPGGQVLLLMTVVVCYFFLVFKITNGPLKSDCTTTVFSLTKPFNSIFERLYKPAASVKESKLRELEQVLENTEGETTNEDRRILQGILKFSETTVQQIMTPMQDVVSIFENDSVFTVNDVLRQNGFSRMPVYSKCGEVIIGSVHAKDIIGLEEQTDIYWQSKIRGIIKVKGDDKIINLLEEFRVKRNHLAMVIDPEEEYLGLATLEDVIEEIVGDISDEFDEDPPIINQLNANLYLLEGNTLLSELIRLNIVEPNDFDELPPKCLTISDLLFHLSNHNPKRRDKINFKNHRFTIESADKKRITRVKLKLNQAQ